MTIGMSCSRVIVLGVRVYRVMVSPLLGPSCRFYPSCSMYLEEAVGRHGVRRGLWMGLKRLGRCHPFHRGGVDPVA